MDRSRFRISVDSIEVTMNGMFGGEPDTTRVFVPGLKRFYVDDHCVSEHEFKAAVEAEAGPPSVTSA
jgi:hypothetical protein